MTTSSLQPLVLGEYPLRGHSLIEASAGTGKTYTIIQLYQRCLMGHNNEIGRLTNQQILMVTFTRAATEELRGRIRQSLRLHLEQLLQIRQCQQAGKSLSDLEFDKNDQRYLWREWLAELVEKHGDEYGDEQYEKLNEQQLQLPEGEALDHLIQWFQLNLAQMDEAAIYTIHGFCQRMLKQFAFDSGVLFDAELVLDAEDYLQRACEDVWRQQSYAASPAVALLIKQTIGSPAALCSSIRGWFSQALATFRAGQRTLSSDDQPWSLQVDELQDDWRQIQALWQTKTEDEWFAFILESGISKQSYSRRFTPDWLAKVSRYFVVDSTTVSDESDGKSNDGIDAEPRLQSPPDELNRFRQSILDEKNKPEKGEPPKHEVFELLDRYLDGLEQLQANLIYQWYLAVQGRYIDLLQSDSALTPDDLLRLLANALMAEGGEQLASKIRQCYPVAMIDEFQDTDATQYQIFSQIYPSSGTVSSIEINGDISRPDEQALLFDDVSEKGRSQVSALVLIGDPKQAIYRFRGADIDTYLLAKRHIDPRARFTLSTNYRSQPSLVFALNQLWSRCDNPFLNDDEIRYQSVTAGRSLPSLYNNQGDPQPQLITADGVQMLPPLQVFEDLATGTKAEERLRIADECAQHIAALMSGREGDQTITPVKAADIAVLVYSGNEAELIRQALAEYRIGSVFLSRTSIFDSEEAADLYAWLAAVTHNSDEFLLRSAVITTSHGMTAEQLASSCQQESDWEAVLSEFYQYRQEWQWRGIMSAIYQWLANDDRAIRLRAMFDGERRLTNILHLGELLQQASRRHKNPSSLLRWLGEKISDPKSHGDEAQLRLETDANLVQIMTIHKSKGLEFPRVMLPFLWTSDVSRKNSMAPSIAAKTYRYNHPRFGNVIQIGEGDFTRTKSEASQSDSASHSTSNSYKVSAEDQQQKDNLAEGLRLVYVAMTRAEISLSIWLCGKKEDPKSSDDEKKSSKKSASKPSNHSTAIGYLLSKLSVPPTAEPDESEAEHSQSRIGEKLAALKDDIFYGSWQSFADSYPALMESDAWLSDDISGQHLLEEVDNDVTGSVTSSAKTTVGARPWQRQLLSNWRVTSFSQLTKKLGGSRGLKVTRSIDSNEAASNHLATSPAEVGRLQTDTEDTKAVQSPSGSESNLHSPTMDASFDFDLEQSQPRDWQSDDSESGSVVRMVNSTTEQALANLLISTSKEERATAPMSPDISLPKSNSEAATESTLETTSQSTLDQPTLNKPTLAEQNADDDQKEGPENTAIVTARQFYRGAQPGTCLHSIFEYWDFKTVESAGSPSKPHSASLDLVSAIQTSLMKYGYAMEEWSPGLQQWMQKVVSHPIITPYHQFCLSDIDPAKRLDEMEFCLPIEQLESRDLNPLIAQGDLDFQSVSGYLKGFIDLIFEYKGRFYVADYKSNYLADSPEGYQQAVLAEAMANKHYDAQAWLYTLALDRFLSVRLPNYDPEQHLGGVLYLFVRGMVLTEQPDALSTADTQQSSGVYYIAIDQQKLTQWRRLLVAKQPVSESTLGATSQKTPETTPVDGDHL